MMHDYGYSSLGGLGMHSSFGLGGWLIPVGFGLLIVIGLVVWLVYANSDRAHAYHATYAPSAPVAPGTYGAPSAPSDSAETIVRERFARGEIDRDEYDRLIAALRR